MSRAPLVVASGFILLSLSGCPVTDDYYIDSAHQPAGSAAGTSGAATGTGGTEEVPQAGTAQGGASQGGVAAAASGGTNNPSGGSATAGTDGVISAGAPDMAGAGGAPAGGAPDPGQAGAGGAAPCVPSTERCNGHDDNCNDLVDELACNSNQNGTTGCTGFVVSSGADHGYMLCTGVPRDWSHARNNCEGQDMRLAWLESADENSAVSATIKKLTNDTEILFGATDQVKEGDWFWDGGAQFRHGNYTSVPPGGPLNGAFESWVPGTPDNLNNDDCATLNPSTGAWSDHSCFATFAYLCEEKP